MDIITYQVEGGRKAVIQVCSRFDFHLHREFRAAYESATGTTSFLIDLQQASYIDSSALGMLLLLRDYAGGDRNAVSIDAKGDVLKIIRSVNFQSLFAVVNTNESPKH